MTVLFDQAIQEFVASYSTNDPPGKEPILEKVDLETWTLPYS